MRKLKLDLETVDVLSFPTTGTPQDGKLALRGTVWDVSRCGFTCQGTSVCCETA